MDSPPVQHQDTASAANARAHSRPDKTSLRYWSIYVLLGICGLVEGFDLQTTGLIGPQIADHFSLSASELGMIFGVTAAGLAIGSTIGGWLGDIDQKWGLTVSLLVMGLASCGAVFAPDLAIFAVMRFFAGMGMGATMPMLIVIASAAGESRYAARRVMLVSTAAPVGGILLALWISLAGSALAWTSILTVGGLAPIVLGVAILMFPRSAFFLHHTVAPHSGKADTSGGLIELFRHGRVGITIMVCGLFVPAIALLYICANWLPFLLREMHFDQPEIGFAIMWWSVGGVLGGLIFGTMTKAGRLARLIAIAYIGLAITAVLLGYSPRSLAVVSALIGMLGFFMTAGTFMLYGIAPLFYAPAVRGVGVGLSLAAGRLGAVIGPTVVGFALAFSASPRVVLVALVPMMIFVLLLAVKLIKQHQYPAD